MLALPSNLTHLQANACLRVLREGLAGNDGPEVVVDASALNRFDSAALAVLLEFRRATLARGKRMLVRGLPRSLGDLATLYGIIELLPPA